MKAPSVLLINPPITQAQRNGPLGPVIKNLYFNSPPLGIAYIAAVLEREHIRVDLMDAAVEDLSMEETLDHIVAFAPTIVGITSTTNFFCNALELAEQLKKRDPHITTVLGGPHVSSHLEKTMDHTCFDFACVGEGEFAMLELVRALESHKSPETIQGLAFRKNGVLHRTPPRPLLEDLDVLPMPARHLLPLDKYVPQPNDGPYLPKTAMISSRGCPFRCIFCDHGVHGNRYRSFSAGRIVDEMQELVNRYRMKDIAFVDSLFMMNAERIQAITDEIRARQLRVHWTCTIRANIATRPLLTAMKKAGCWRVRVGIESGNEEVLSFIKKEVTKEQVRQVTQDAHNVGLRPKGFFIIGHPTETAERIQESIDFAKSLPLTDVTVQVNTPLPGAPQWELYKDHGTLVTEDLKRYSFWEPVFVPSGLTQEALNDLHSRFYRAFYFRPIIIWRHLAMLRRFSDLVRYARALSLLINMFVKKRKRTDDPSLQPS